MIGRRKFVATGMSAVAIAAAGRGVMAQVGGEASEHGDHASHDNPKMKECAKACSDCQRACDSCSTHCAQKLAGGDKTHLATLMSCQDCADVCAAASQIVARGGPFSELICGPCAEACAKCAAACEKFPDDDHMKQCAEECRKCEKSCREMVHA